MLLRLVPGLGRRCRRRPTPRPPSDAATRVPEVRPCARGPGRVGTLRGRRMIFWLVPNDAGMFIIESNKQNRWAILFKFYACQNEGIRKTRNKCRKFDFKYNLLKKLIQKYVDLPQKTWSVQLRNLPQMPYRLQAPSNRPVAICIFFLNIAQFNFLLVIFLNICNFQHFMKAFDFLKLTTWGILRFPQITWYSATLYVFLFDFLKTWHFSPGGVMLISHHFRPTWPTHGWLPQNEANQRQLPRGKNGGER